MRAVLTLAMLVGIAVPAYATETPIPPAPTRWVTDTSGFISELTRSELDARLQRYQETTDHQVIVWIGSTLGDAPIEEWCAKAFKAWGIGSKAKDDGVAIFVFPVDRKMRIEVGYGLEDKLPDAYASRIIHDVMEPALHDERNDAAISGGVAQVLERLGGEVNGVANGSGADSGFTERPQPLPATSPWKLVVGGIVLLILLIVVITNPRLAMLMLWNIGGGRGGGGFGGGGFGGGGGGGGFSGGGGSSGGGGANGSW